MTRTRRQIILWLLLGPGLLVAVLVLNDPLGRWRVAHELDLCRKAGMRVDAADYERPAVPDDLNAAPLYLQAFDEMEQLEASATPQEQFDQYLVEYYATSCPSSQSAVLTAAMGRYLKRHEHVLALVEEATDRPHCQYPAESEFFRTHLGDSLAISRLMSYRIAYLVRTGDCSGAVHVLSRNMRLDRCVGEDDVILTGKVRSVIIDGITDALREMVEEGVPVTREQCTTLFGLLPSRNQIVGIMRHSLGGDIHQHRKGAWDTTSRPWSPLRLFRRYQEADEVEALRFVHEHLDRPYAEIRRLPWPSRRWYQEDYWLFACLDTLAAEPFSCNAKLDLLRIGLLLEMHRQHTGDYPQSLSDLRLADGDVLPKDPFTGQPYHYRRDGDGYLLWSLGKNCKDDSADPTEDAIDSEDVVLWVGTRARAAHLMEREAYQEEMIQEAREDAGLPAEDEEDEDENEDE